MSQVRTFIEMDSHEERVYVAVRQTQEREAKQKMREKAKELSRLQKTKQLSKGSPLMSPSATSPMSESKSGDNLNDLVDRGSSIPQSKSLPVRPKVKD